MTNFQNTFGGSAVTSTDVAYAAYSYNTNLQLFWPQFSAGQANVAARFMSLTPGAAALNVFMPDATLVSPGYDSLIFNPGIYNINIVSFTGAAIATISPGQTYYVILNNNTTQSGSWQTVQFGVGTGSANAAALAGQGLIAAAGVLNVNFNASVVATNYTVTTANRATLQVWTGGNGAIQLPLASSVGNGFFFPFANNGSGNVTFNTTGGDQIDGASSSVFGQTQSGFIFSSGTSWYTVGKGIQNMSGVSLLNLNVAGGSNITETSAQAQNTLQQFTGVLTANINVIVPNTVQLYYIYNNTSGSFTTTLKTAAGSGVTIAQGTHTILYCDGTNVINAYTASVSSTVSVSPGSANAPNINFVGSGNTGFYSPTVGQIAVTAGGFEVMNFISQASSVNYLEVSASATTTPVSLTARGSDGNIGVNYVTKGSGSHNFLGNGGATQFYIGNVASAVNQLNVTGAATTTNPILAASGSDTNIGINYNAKGTGVHTFNTGIVAPTFTGNLVGNVTGGIPGTSLTGTVLATNIVTSSLTTLGTITTGIWAAGIINPTYGGTPVYVSVASATGTANAIVVAATLPSSFTFSAGKIVTVFPSANNTGAVTLNVNGTGAATVYKANYNGLVPLTGGEFVTGINAYVFCDGTQYQLLNPVAPNFGTVTAAIVNVVANATVGGNLGITGNTTFSGTLTGSGQANLGNITASGTITSNTHTVISTSGGNFQGAYFAINNSSAAGTQTALILQPSTNGSRTAGLIASNDGSDNISLLVALSAGGAAAYRAAILAGGGLQVYAGGSAPSGPTNDGDVNIAGQYKVNGVPLQSNYNLIATANVSAVANVVFSSGFNSSLYVGYRFVINNIVPNSNNQDLRFTLSSNGGTSYATALGGSYTIGGSPVSDTLGIIMHLLQNAGGQNGAILDIIQMDTTQGPVSLGQATGDFNGAFGILQKGEVSTLTAALNAVKFAISSGTFSGSIRMYGLLR